MNLKQVLIFILCATFFACSTESSDTSGEEITDIILPKKIITDYGIEKFTTIMKYDGNKLISCESDNGNKTNYAYKNDKLDRIDHYVNGELWGYATLSYNSKNELESCINYFEYDVPYVWKSVYIYNTDGTITEKAYIGDSVSQAKLSQTYTYTFKGDNVVKYATDYEQFLYEYDNKNGATKNIHDIKVFNLLHLDLGAIEGNLNNITKLTNKNSDGDIIIDEYNYTYNENNYPTTAAYKGTYNGEINEGLIEYFYSDEESTDTFGEETTDLTLIKNIIYNKNKANQFTENFTYNGNKLASVVSDDNFSNYYTYNNEKLIREDFFVDNDLLAYIILEYSNDGKLSNFREYFSEISEFSGKVYNHILTYNNDNTISIDTYLGDENAQTKLYRRKKITYNGKNILKIDDNIDNSIKLYEYDNKNGIFKNIHVIEILNILNATTKFGTSIFANTNNIVSSSINEFKETYEYTYNDKNYPKTARLKSVSGGVIGEYQIETMEFFYK